MLMMRIAGVASELCGLSVGLQEGKLRALFGAHCCVARGACRDQITGTYQPLTLQARSCGLEGAPWAVKANLRLHARSFPVKFETSAPTYRCYVGILLQEFLLLWEGS